MEQIPRQQIPHDRFQAEVALHRMCLIGFKANPAFIETIEHGDARRHVSVGSVGEDAGPCVARHGLGTDGAAKQIRECRGDVVGRDSPRAFQLHDLAGRKLEIVPLFFAESISQAEFSMNQAARKNAVGIGKSASDCSSN
jgi:hypothetical protein